MQYVDRGIVTITEHIVRSAKNSKISDFIYSNYKNKEKLVSILSDDKSSFNTILEMSLSQGNLQFNLDSIDWDQYLDSLFVPLELFVASLSNSKSRSIDLDQIRENALVIIGEFFQQSE